VSVTDASKVSSEDSDSEMQLPDPDESSIPIAGKRAEPVYDTTAWNGQNRVIQFDNRVPESGNQYPECVTPADKHMYGIGGRRVLQETEFLEHLHFIDVRGVCALEQKRYEECPTAPSPGNEAVVGAVLVVWTDQVITNIKNQGSGM
jgi:hypothetical protein